MADLTTPYAHAAPQYWDAGWRGILPLPVNQKYPPPNGYTGANGQWPSYADITDWAYQTPDANIALRLPPTLIGLDVDNYGDKNGGNTLADLVQECGPLPATWLSTSRGDGVSGIRLYAIPDGVRLITALPGVELIQHHHRYTVAWPSIHPATGDRYQWLNETTGEIGDLPHANNIPPLPQTWVQRLTATNTPTSKNPDINPEPVIQAFPPGPACHHIRSAAGKVLTAPGQTRHDTYRDAVLAIMGHARRGCPGGKDTLATLRDLFVNAISYRATPVEATTEYGNLVTGAAQIVGNEPPGTRCIDDLSWIPDQPEPPTSHTTDTDDDDDDGAGFEWAQAVARKAAEYRLADEARQYNATRITGELEPLTATPLNVFVNEPDEPVAYRVHNLWPSQGRTLLVAAAKAGKTTMIGRNLLPCLADGGLFLGEYEVQPVTGTVVYLNLEVGPNVMRKWLRESDIRNKHRIHVMNLRGRVSQLTLGTSSGRERFGAFLATINAEVVILDPLAPLLAAHGLDENSNTDVAAFFSWWGEALTIGEVGDDLIAHHAGHAGERSRGASRLLDEPDAIWTITTDRGHQGDNDDDAPILRCLTAYGRDVEQPERVLTFDPDTGLLSLEDRGRKAFQAASFEQQRRTQIVDQLRAHDGPGLSQNAIVRGNGNEKSMIRALNSLVREGVVVENDLGKGRGRLFQLLGGQA